MIERSNNCSGYIFMNACWGECVYDSFLVPFGRQAFSQVRAHICPNGLVCPVWFDRPSFQVELKPFWSCCCCCCNWQSQAPGGMDACVILSFTCTLDCMIGDEHTTGRHNGSVSSCNGKVWGSGSMLVPTATKNWHNNSGKANRCIKKGKTSA